MRISQSNKIENSMRKLLAMIAAAMMLVFAMPAWADTSSGSTDAGRSLDAAIAEQMETAGIAGVGAARQNAPPSGAFK